MTSTATNAGAGSARRMHWAWSLAALACVIFGVMAIQFNFALRGDGTNWWAEVQTALTSPAYSLGPASAHHMYPIYRRALAAMSSHTALGGAALTLAVLQFVPALRRRHRSAHRLAGALVIVAAGASMLGALTYLARTPLSEVYASPAFGLALWALALACLGYLALAMLAIRRRDLRSHMGFMALMMGTLLTAPVLRFEWALLGMGSGYDMSEVNQGVVASLAVVCNLIMSLWMHHVGAADLPPRRRACVPSAPLLNLGGPAAAFVIVHEGVLAPWGLDLLGAWRGADLRLPVQALLWALPAAALAWRAPRDIEAIVNGARLPELTRKMALAVALGAPFVGLDLGGAGVDAVGLRFYWMSYALLSVLLVMAARFSTRSDEPWSVLLLFLALAPALWPLLWLVAWLCAQPFAVAMWFAATVGLAAMSGNAFLTAFGIRLPFGARTPA